MIPSPAGRYHRKQTTRALNTVDFAHVVSVPVFLTTLVGPKHLVLSMYFEKTVAIKFAKLFRLKLTNYCQKPTMERV